MPSPEQDADRNAGQSAGEEAGGGFLSRWSRRKAQVRQGVAVAEPAAPQAMPAPLAVLEPPPAPVVVPAAPDAVPDVAPAVPAPPAPTLVDVAALTQESDFTRFVAPGVDSSVKNAALKKLFTNPHFNVMDGLDTYIDDYGQPDPLPEGMLRQLAQSQLLGLFADEPGEPRLVEATPNLSQDPIPDENADLRLQPHGAAGPAGPDQSPGQGAGGEH